MRNVRKDRRNVQKIISTVISLGVIVTLAFGIYSVVHSVSKGNDKNNNNIVNLNETQENVAIKTEDITRLQLTDDNEDGTQGAEAANAKGSMTGVNEKGSQAETSTPAPTQEPTEEPTEEPTVPPTLSLQEVMAENLKAYTFTQESKLEWPVNGEITLGYSMDTTILFKSLGMYKCNPAVIIRAEKGTNVAAAASGIVEEVSTNSETGTTVVVSIGNGYQTTTGLIENVSVKEGDTVTAGQLLGTVASPSAYYIEEGPGVYFMLTHDGIPVDPGEFLSE